MTQCGESFCSASNGLVFILCLKMGRQGCGMVGRWGGYRGLPGGTLTVRQPSCGQGPRGLWAAAGQGGESQG